MDEAQRQMLLKMTVDSAAAAQQAKIDAMNAAENAEIVMSNMQEISNMLMAMAPPDEPELVMHGVTTDPLGGIAPVSIDFTADVENAERIDWVFGDGGTATGMSARHTFTVKGEYTVTMTAYRGDKNDSASVVIRIEEAPKPVPTATVSASPSAGVSPFKTTIVVSGQDFDPTATVVDFGDGSAVATGSSHQHTYNVGNKAATFTIKATVTGPGGQKEVTYTVSVSPQEAPPDEVVTRVITPFDKQFFSVPLELADASKNQLFQRFEDGGVLEFMVWQDNETPNEILVAAADGSTKGLTGKPLLPGFVETALTTPNGTFTYGTWCHEDTRVDYFGSKCQRVSIQMSYHLYTRMNLVCYMVEGEDDDLVTTRVLSEWLDPFKPDSTGVVLLIGYDRMDMRAYHNGVLVYNNDLNPYNYAAWGYAGNPFRSTGNRTPSDTNWTSYDNGTDADFLETHDFTIYTQRGINDVGIEGTYMSVVENGFIKINRAFIPIVIEKLHPMFGGGAYHVIDNGINDLLNQQAAGNQAEPRLLEWARKDLTIHRFGPLDMEILDAMPVF